VRFHEVLRGVDRDLDFHFHPPNCVVKGGGKARWGIEHVS